MSKKIFRSQNEGENVLYVWGRHPFTLIPEEIIPSFLLLISLGTMIFFYDMYFVFLGAFVFFIFFSVWTFYAYFVWAGDKYIVTDHRVIDIDQLGLFIRSEKEAPLDRVQDITIKIKGFWGALFRYGDVIVQTASDTEIVLGDVSNPGKVQKIISDLNKATIQAKAGGKDEIISKIENLVGEYKRAYGDSPPISNDSPNENPV